MDNTTDALIQETIQTEFRDCTVLTIAHRLESILTNDYVLVLDNGHVLEYDSPSVLLSNSNSHFCQMISQMNRNAAEK